MLYIIIYGMAEPTPLALQAIRAWLRLDTAFAQFNRHVQRVYGVTGAQLAMLRLIQESEPVTLATLRARLSMHPATLGQLVERLEKLGFVTRVPAPVDRRRRQVTLTVQGRQLLLQAPLAGPVRLRSVLYDEAQLRALIRAFDAAIACFGLEEWAP